MTLSTVHTLAKVYPLNYKVVRQRQSSARGMKSTPKIHVVARRTGSYAERVRLSLTESGTASDIRTLTVLRKNGPVVNAKNLCLGKRN